MPIRTDSWCSRARAAFSRAIACWNATIPRTPASAPGKTQNTPSPTASTMRPCASVAAWPSRSKCSWCSWRPTASPKRAKYGVEPTMSENTMSSERSKRRRSSFWSWFCRRTISVMPRVPRVLRSIIGKGPGGRARL
jgi:hypothetical protein